MSPLRNEEKRALLEIARRSVSLIVIEHRELRVSSPGGILDIPSGAFVTLQKRGRLRGCIGRIEPEDPLAHVVAQCAAAAAMEDPRFPPLEPHELVDLEIEISVLSRMEMARPEQVEPGHHGLMVSRGWQRGVLLPQVAIQYGWSRERFLEETCRKGGLEPQAWMQPETRIEVFTAEVFSESEMVASENSAGKQEPFSPDHSSSQ